MVMVRPTLDKSSGRDEGGYLALGGGFAADCDLLQGVTMAEGLQWRQQSWDRGDGAQGLGTSLFSSSRCL